jgi:hypothetical protein
MALRGPDFKNLDKSVIGFCLFDYVWQPFKKVGSRQGRHIPHGLIPAGSKTALA